MFCSKCGAENEDEALFCNKCGEKFNKNSSQPTEKICPKCNEKNEIESDFCEKCGTKLDNNHTDNSYKSPIQISNRETKFDLRTVLVTSVVIALTYIILEVISSNVSNDFIVLTNLLYLYCLIAGLLGGFIFNRLNNLEHNYINNIIYCVFGLIIIMLYYGLTGGEVGGLSTQITNLVLILIGSFIGSYLERNALY